MPFRTNAIEELGIAGAIQGFDQYVSDDHQREGLRLPLGGHAVVGNGAGRRLQQQLFRVEVGADDVDEIHPVPNPVVRSGHEREGSSGGEPAKAYPFVVNVVLSFKIPEP